MSHPDSHTSKSKKKLSLSTIAIIVALILCAVLIMTYPGVDPDADFIERMDYIFSDFRPYADDEYEDEDDDTDDAITYAQPQSEADAAFIALMEEFITEDVEEEYDRLMTLHTEFLPLFEAVDTKKLADPALQTCAKDMVRILKDWGTSIYVNDKGETEGIEDWLLWSQCRVDLCGIVNQLHATYNLLPETPYVPQQYDYILPIWQAQLTVQQDLDKQLSKPKKQWSAEEKCYYITYTNNTEFEMDVTVYGDYFTAEHRYFTDKIHATGLKPGESVTLYMKRMPDDVANWVADWVVDKYYVDGIDIYDYF